MTKGKRRNGVESYHIIVGISWSSHNAKRLGICEFVYNAFNFLPKYCAWVGGAGDRHSTGPYCVRVMFINEGFEKEICMGLLLLCLRASRISKFVFKYCYVSLFCIKYSILSCFQERGASPQEPGLS